MSINWQTEKKINEIKELLQTGYSLKDILQKKFNRSTQKLKAHIEENKAYYSLEEYKILSGEMVEEGQEVPTLLKAENSHNLTNILDDKANLKALELLLKNSSKIIQLIEKADLESNTIDHLNIPKGFLTEEEIKVKSFRIAKSIDFAFDSFCDTNKEYNKTELFNFALKEFIEKYQNK